MEDFRLGIEYFGLNIFEKPSIIRLRNFDLSQISNPQSKNLKSKIVTLCQSGDCAADKQTKPDETPIDRNPAKGFQ